MKPRPEAVRSRVACPTATGFLRATAPLAALARGARDLAISGAAAPAIARGPGAVSPGV